MHELTTNQKGLIAENAVIREAILLGIGVARPLDDERYDLILDFGPTLVRAQCKWAVRKGDIVLVNCYTSRRGPHGMIIRRYSEDEIDAFVAYCAELDRCYYLPRDEFDGKRFVHLRLAPSKNNQRAKTNAAGEYEFDAKLAAHVYGPIAQLGERRHGMAEAVGSSPTGSIADTDFKGN